MIKKPESIIILIGDLKIITVEATSDPSTPIKYSWLFKGNNQEYELLKVTPEGSYFFGEGENGTSLTIFYRDESIFGSYKVIASNGISEESSEFRLQSGDGGFFLSNFSLLKAVLTFATISNSTLCPMV